MIGPRNDRQRRPRQRDRRYRRLGVERVEGRLLLSVVLGDPLAEGESNAQPPAQTASEDPDAAAADEEQAAQPGILVEGGFVPVEGNEDVPRGGTLLLASGAVVSHGTGSSEGIEIRRVDPGELQPAGPGPGLIDLTWVAERPVEAGAVPLAGSEGAPRSPTRSAARTRAEARSDRISEGGSLGRSQAFELAAQSSQSARESGSAFGHVELATVRFGGGRSAGRAAAGVLGVPSGGERVPSTAHGPRCRHDHGEGIVPLSERPLRDEVLFAREGGRPEGTSPPPPAVLEAAPRADSAESPDATREDATEPDDLRVAYLENRRRDEAVPLVALAVVHWQLSRPFWHPFEERPRRKLPNGREP